MSPQSYLKLRRLAFLGLLIAIPVVVVTGVIGGEAPIPQEDRKLWFLGSLVALAVAAVSFAFLHMSSCPRCGYRFAKKKGSRNFNMFAPACMSCGLSRKDL